MPVAAAALPLKIALMSIDRMSCGRHVLPEAQRVYSSCLMMRVLQVIAIPLAPMFRFLKLSQTQFPLRVH